MPDGWPHLEPVPAGSRFTTERSRPLWLSQANPALQNGARLCRCLDRFPLREAATKLLVLSPENGRLISAGRTNACKACRASCPTNGRSQNR